MDYLMIYERLIARAKNRTLEGYYERHHVIPRCLNGSNSPDNLVSLTAREHYVAHQLLVKLHPDHRGVIYSAKMMTIAPNGRRSCNRLYEWLKTKASQVDTTDIREKAWQTRRENGFDRMTEESKAKMRESKRHISQETRARMRSAQKDRTCSLGTRMKMSETRKGRTAFNKGKPAKLSSKNKISKSLLELYARDGHHLTLHCPTFECEHCRRTIRGASNYYRWHHDNCRHSPLVT